MHAQLDRLIHVCERPRITLQILTFAAGMHPAAFSLVYLLRFPGKEMPDVVYGENMTNSWYYDKPQVTWHTWKPSTVMTGRAGGVPAPGSPATASSPRCRACPVG